MYLGNFKEVSVQVLWATQKKAQVLGNFKIGECPGHVGHPKEGACAVVSMRFVTCVVYAIVVSRVPKFVTLFKEIANCNKYDYVLNFILLNNPKFV
jgi:hypothetical protein